MKEELMGPRKRLPGPLTPKSADEIEDFAAQKPKSTVASSTPLTGVQTWHLKLLEVFAEYRWRWVVVREFNDLPTTRFRLELRKTDHGKIYVSSWGVDFDNAVAELITKISGDG
jgi:hypothetical protein